MKKILLFLLIVLSLILISEAGNLQKAGKIKKNIITSFDANFSYPTIGDIQNDKVYIFDLSRNDSSVSIYSIKNPELISKFGKKGRGPGEFLWITAIKAYNDKIWVQGAYKNDLFDKNGKLLKEIKNPPRSICYPMDNNRLVCSEKSFSKKGELIIKYFTYNTEDSKRVKLYEFSHKTGQWKTPEGKIKDMVYFVMPMVRVDEKNRRIIIGTPHKGLFFKFYDFAGKHIKDIKIIYEKNIMSEKIKKEYFKYLKSIMSEKEFNNSQKRFKYIFPKRYPPYSDFVISNGKIYVYANPIIDGKQKIMVIQKGKIIKETTVPARIFDNPEIRFYIKNGIYYYLEFNDNAEKWDIYSIKID